MKRVAHLSLRWHDQSPEAAVETRRFVEDLIHRYRLKVKEFPPDRRFCYLAPLDADRPRFRELMEEIERRGDLNVSLRIWPSYTAAELASAPLLLWYLTNQAIEDDWYDLHEDGYQGGPKASHRRCPACRAELEQVRDLWVDVGKMGKRDLSLTYSFEVILSARLAQRLRESGLTGFTLRPVWDYRRPHQGEPRLFQLIVSHALPPMASPPTEFERIQRCEVCGTESRYLKHTHWWGRIKYYEETDVYYPREVLAVAADFNRTAERFGELPDASPYGIISQRAYRWLREQNVKGWKAEPVVLVE